MKRKKAIARLAMRRKQWDAMSAGAQRATRRPGSYKKDWPLGRNR